MFSEKAICAVEEKVREKKEWYDPNVDNSEWHASVVVCIEMQEM